MRYNVRTAECPAAVHDVCTCIFNDVKMLTDWLEVLFNSVDSILMKIVIIIAIFDSSSLIERERERETETEKERVRD